MRRSKIQQHRQGGFTLVELMLALFSFSLILTMGYQAISSTALGQHNVVNRVSHQESLRAAYRTLSNAVASGAPMQGDSGRVQFDLSHANSSWLLNSKVLLIAIGDDGKLLAQDDQQTQVSELMAQMVDAKFAYHQQGVDYARWNKPDTPDWLTLTWRDKGRQFEWRFVTP